MLKWPWIWILLTAAVVKCALGIGGFLAALRDAASIERGLQLPAVSFIHLLVYAGVGGLVANREGLRPLPRSSSLAKILAGASEPLEVDLKSPRSALRRLSLEERDWLADGNVCLLVPLLASDGSLSGLIALGEKRSELPFSREDRSLLTAIASSVALTMQNRLLLSNPSTKTGKARGPAAFRNAVAAECATCGGVQPGHSQRCPECGGVLHPATTPYVLAGKFRFERRIGAGAMGVVYLATDLTLERKVAIKTLPRISPELARSLRREARAMAAVSHPNLAAIFGAETWRGVPLLVFEFLEGGTLSGHLVSGHRLTWNEMLDLGIALSGVLNKLHAAGILHRDVKPSNIGYTADEVPKLLDLGLAKIVSASYERQTNSFSTSPDQSDEWSAGVPLEIGTAHRHLVGTLAYLSPEAILGHRPGPLFDLWSLAIVLFEALTGIQPIRAATAQETLARILRAEIPDIRVLLPECPAAAAQLFDELLAREPSRRPATALALSTRLKIARDSISAHPVRTAANLPS